MRERPQSSCYIAILKTVGSRTVQSKHVIAVSSAQDPCKQWLVGDSTPDLSRCNHFGRTGKSMGLGRCSRVPVYHRLSNHLAYSLHCPWLKTQFVCVYIYIYIYVLSTAMLHQWEGLKLMTGWVGPTNTKQVLSAPVRLPGNQRPVADVWYQLQRVAPKTSQLSFRCDLGLPSLCVPLNFAQWIAVMLLLVFKGLLCFQKLSYYIRKGLICVCERVVWCLSFVVCCLFLCLFVRVCLRGGSCV